MLATAFCFSIVLVPANARIHAGFLSGGKHCTVKFRSISVAWILFYLVSTRRKVAHSGRSPHGEGQRLIELALIPKSVSPRQEAEVFRQECHATERSPQPVSGDDRNLHVLPDDCKRVTEQMSAGTILAEKASCLEAPRNRMPSLCLLSPKAKGHFGSCPQQSTAGSPRRTH